MSGAPTPRRRIVIAEDDPAIATMLQKVLSAHYDVVVVHDGKAALAFVHDGRVFGVKAHGVDMASRELHRTLLATE